MDVFGEFTWRGIVAEVTDGLPTLLARERVTAYAGFDPTAPSLHVGSLMPLLALARLQRAGHPPIAVLGGGTGLIGDPSGKTGERQLIEADQVQANVAGIRAQVARFLDVDSRVAPARVVDNADWLTRLGAIEFMREIGKHFTVNYMLAKESVKGRIEREDGISYTEFSYLLLQAYDFLVLHDRFGCTLQLGGSDQWGNITAGVELLRRLRAARVHGLVLPLVLTASGAKFGKTEAGTVWLDPGLTSPYAFYQYWLNTDDRDAARYLRFFTFLDRDRIDALEAAGASEPERRIPQRELAREVTRLVHGDRAVHDAEVAADTLFGGDLSTMSVADLLEVFPNVPSSTLPFDPHGWPLVDLLVSAGVTGSRSEATRLIRGGGTYVNDRRIADEKARLHADEAIGGELFVIRKGRKENFLIRIRRD
jgi:tyrosyl-tRNA synthetase